MQIHCKMEVLRDMHLPPGFGFHPSDAELISHYLKRKIHGQRIEYDLIPEVDIYKHEPWDLPSKCNLPIEDNKWHFFASRDRKYPTGARSNRQQGLDAFVLCRVTRRDDWALENDNGVGNRNPHPQHLSDAVTAVVVVEKQEEATSSGICAGVVVVEKQEEASSSSICAGVVVVEKQEDTTALGICAGEPNHVGTPASAELSNDVAPTEFMAHSPNSESEMNAWLEELLVDLSSNPAVDTGSAVPVEQDVESANLQNPSSVDPKMEPDNASPIQNGMDGTDYLNGDFYSMFDFNDAFAAYSMMETDHFISTNNSEGTWNGEVQVHQGTQGREVQSHAVLHGYYRPDISL
ncbi:hypothetical protein PR202_ga23917 [Eleusine coracana subsp. coracana]|uniref:NAC domain-containing protein n=1 Tax=Eleusine coracana subsp. coracana TaxID=191504 RepID=A0AAV5D6H4_ELECO|nr:hypothetical protein PR202_ga23917 [Eleusine coracana subsp. coracana]